MKIELRKKIPEQVKKIEKISKEKLMKCYQCGRCSAGCPVVSMMDLLPNQVIRLLQLGESEEVLNCKTIWVCASCFTCFVRCPKGIDFAKIAEGCRLILLRENIDKFGPEVIKKRMRSEQKIPPIAIVSYLRKFSS